MVFRISLGVLCERFIVKIHRVSCHVSPRFSGLLLRFWLDHPSFGIQDLSGISFYLYGIISIVGIMEVFSWSSSIVRYFGVIGDGRLALASDGCHQIDHWRLRRIWNPLILVCCENLVE